MSEEVVTLEAYTAPVTKSISTERTYNLGNYQNVKFFESWNGIPEDLAVTPEFMALVQMFTFIRFELAYQEYLEEYEEIKKLKANPKELISYLEEKLNNISDDIVKTFKDFKIKNENKVEGE